MYKQLSVGTKSRYVQYQRGGARESKTSGDETVYPRDGVLNSDVMSNVLRHLDTGSVEKLSSCI